MNISLLIDGAAFDPEEVEVLSRCYEAVLQDLGLALREDPITLLVAERVIEFATLGERNPNKLHEQVLTSLED